MPEESEYRPSAGIVLFNEYGKVFLGRRKGLNSPYVWQFPQGGIDADEKPKKAAIRELEEETGIPSSLITPLGRIKEWLYYDFPNEHRNTRKFKIWRGQRQKWYAFQFTGKDNQINLSAHRHIEFTDWRWDTLDHAIKIVVPFKKTVYERVAKEFKKYESAK